MARMSSQRAILLGLAVNSSGLQLILQRDLKAGNVLVEKDGTILLADFGVGGDMNDPLTPIEKPRQAVEHFQFRPTVDASLLAADNPSDASGDISGKRKSFVGTVSCLQPCLSILTTSRAGWHLKLSCSRDTMVEQIYGAWALRS